MQNSGTSLVKVFSTPLPADIALIKSLLDSCGIKYFVTNENINMLYGPADGFTAMSVLVEENKAGEARELLKEFIKPNKPDKTT
jgi:hypothetical protein